MDHQQKNHKTERTRGLSRKNKRGNRKGDTNDSPEIPGRRMTSDIPSLPSGPYQELDVAPNHVVLTVGVIKQTIQVPNIAIYQISESKSAHTKVYLVTGLNDKIVWLCSGFVVQLCAAVFKCIRGCITVMHKWANSHHCLSTARILVSQL